VHLRGVRKFLALTAVVLIAAACSGDDKKASPQERESKTRQGGYEELAARQPAKTMKYSPSRETINYWIETWNKPGKLSFVYLMAGNGQFVGYYVLKGLPVSYCAALTPNYEFRNRDTGDFHGDILVPAPGVDGVYYSGGQCNQYYGVDATTGAYIEFSIGGSLNYLLFDQPLPVEVAPLGFTKIEDITAPE
jgi:hypothetical protein